MSAPAVAAAEADVANALKRAAVYRLLGLALSYPDADALAHVARLAAHAEASAPPAVREALAALGAAAAAADVEELAAAYVAMFDRGDACPPYEGAWAERPAMGGKGTALADIAGFYRAFGVAPSADRPDIEDHVAAELEFMSLLALKEAAALADGGGERLEVTRAAQTAFLGDHLGRWADAFATALGEAAVGGYFAAAGAALAAWIAAERAALAVSAPAAPPTPLRVDTEPFTCPMAADCAAESPEPKT